MVRDFRKWSGKRRRSGVVKMEKVCCRMYEMSAAPNTAHIAIGPVLSHFQVLPAKVRTTWKRVKTVALRTVPTQSIRPSLVGPETSGCGLCFGKRKK